MRRTTAVRSIAQYPIRHCGGEGNLLHAQVSQGTIDAINCGAYRIAAIGGGRRISERQTESERRLRKETAITGDRTCGKTVDIRRCRLNQRGAISRLGHLAVGYGRV